MSHFYASVFQYIYIEACSRLNIDPSECLVFEDTEAGVRAAKTAGCCVIAVPTKWTTNQNFELADQLIVDLDPEKFIQLMEQRIEVN